MKKRVVTLSEGRKKVTNTGVSRTLLLLPENVGIKKCEMGVLMLKPGQSWGYPDHHHADEEAYFILQGTGVQTIDDEKYDIGKHMAVYLPPDSVHITENTGDDPLWVLYVRTPEEYR